MSTGEEVEEENLNTGRDCLGKEKVEVKEYLSQLFLHFEMLSSLCKSPNLKDSWEIKKKRAENQVLLIMV